MQTSVVQTAIKAMVVVAWLGIPATVWPDQPERGPALTILPPEAQNAGRAAGRRLEAVDDLVKQKQWAEAVSECQRILEESGDVLVAVNAHQCVAARRLCHQRLATLPGEALQLYRARVDDQALKWLEQGTATRDPRWLRRLVDETFASRHTDQAIDRLGDLAFERGDLAEADRWWRMLETAPGDRPAGTELVFPDPRVEPARTRAKRILVRLFRGDRDGLTNVLKAYAEQHGKAEGSLAGRKGKYHVILQDLAAQADLVPPPIEDPSWSTFAGDASRNRVLPQGPRLQWSDGQPAWRAALGNGDRKGEPESQPPLRVLGSTAAMRALAFHPVVVGDLVLVADARRVTAYDLLTGKVRGRCDLIDDLKVEFRQEARHELLKLDLKLPTRLDIRYTLTVSGNRVYARLGTQAVASVIDPIRKEPCCGDSFLVCLGLPPNRDNKFPIHWKQSAEGERRGLGPPVKANQPRDRSIFEGAPVVRDGRAWMARTQFAEGRVITSIDCYDAESGALRWKQEVCQVRESREGEPRYRHHLLTLAGSQVVYCSHAGAIVAVDAEAGRRTWSVQYPSRGLRLPDGSPNPRDTAPAVCADGRLFVAPADHDRILCLEAATGQTLWESQPIEVMQLLGVAPGMADSSSNPPSAMRNGSNPARDRLIFTTGTRPRGIRAIDAGTGKPLRDWIQPGDGSGELSTRGRGLLAGGLVFWPTQEGLRILQQDDGTPTMESYPWLVRGEPLGNLAMSNGCLVVASERELRAYLPPSLRKDEGGRMKAAGDPSILHPSAFILHPSEAGAQYGLALMQADAGNWSAALDHLQRADALADPADRWQGTPPHQRIRQRRFQVLVAKAQSLSRAGERRVEGGGRSRPSLPPPASAAAAAWAQAAAPEFPVPWRLQALASLAAFWEQQACPDRIVAVWQSVLTDPELRRGYITGKDRLPQLASMHAAARIRDQLRLHGPGIYAPYEKQAESLVKEAARPAATGGLRSRRAPPDAGDSRTDPRRTETAIAARLADEFPNASATVAFLRQLAQAQEQAGRDGEALQTYRKLLRCGDERGQWRVEGGGRKEPLHPPPASAAAGLARIHERQGHREAARGAWQRLAQEWGDRPFPGSQPEEKCSDVAARHLRKLAPADEVRPLTDVPRRLQATWQVSPVSPPGERRGVSPPVEGGERRGATSPVTAELLFVRDNQHLVCRDAATGQECWSLAVGHALAWAARHADLVIVAGENGISGIHCATRDILWQFRDEDRDLSTFRLAASRLFFLDGGWRMLALDVETGQFLWQREAPSGRLDFGFRISDFGFEASSDRVLARLSGGRCWVLRSLTGELAHELPPDHGPLTTGHCLLDERRFVLPKDPQRITMFDPATGKGIWTGGADEWRWPSLTGEGFQVMRDPRHLLMCVSRNHGWELERLDIDTGRRLWPTPLLISGQWPVASGQRPVASVQHIVAHDSVAGAQEWPLAADHRRLATGPTIAADGQAVYVVHGGALHAHALVDRRSLWSLPLPRSAGPWQVVPTRETLLIYPMQAQVGLDPKVIDRRLLGLALFPSLHRLRLLLLPLEDAYARRHFPLIICDPKTGQVLQRFAFAMDGPGDANLRQAGSLALLAGHLGLPASGSRSWGPRADLAIADGRVVVVLEGAAWGLASPAE